MMKRQWRILYAALAVVMVMMMAAGCTVTPAPVATDKPAATQKPPAEPTTPPADEKPVTLTWYVIGNGEEPDSAKVVAKVNEYVTPKMNVIVDFRTIGWGEYNDKINPMLAAGEKFDLVFTANWAANYLLNGSSGYFMELTDLINEHGQGIMQSVGADFLHASAINGKQYTIPTNKEHFHNWGVILKKDLVDKYKVDVASIKKLQDLEPAFEQIKAGEQGVYPLLVVNMEAPYKLLDWDKISDDDVPGALYPNNDASNTTIVNDYTAAEAIESYKLVRSYHEKGYINPDAATQDNFANELKTEKYFAAVQSLKPGKDAEMSVSTGIEWVQVDLTTPLMTNRETTGSMVAIPAASVNSVKAMQFLNLVYTDPFIVNTLVFGVEGEHYVKVSENVIKMGPANEGDTPAYAPGNPWRFGNQFLNFLMENERPDKWELWQKANDSTIALNSLGFIFNGEIVSNEASACKAVIQKYYKQLFTGSVDVDSTVTAMEGELKAAGVDTVIAEMQKQYDAWRASK